MNLFIRIQLLIILITVHPVFNLQCRTAKPLKCRWNSSCEHGIEICNQRLSDIRGGIYCSTLIYDLNEILIENMGCMYDQETTKTCQNQSQCFMKFTNSERKFLHCCCDKDFCNINLNLSDPIINLNGIESTKSMRNNLFQSNNSHHCSNRKSSWFCKYQFLWKQTTILFILFLFLMIILFVLIIFQWNFLRKCFIRLLNKTKFNSSKCSKSIKTNIEEPDFQSPLISTNHQTEKFIDFNQLNISEKSLKQGKFSQIYSAQYQNQRVAIKYFQGNSINSLIYSIFNHEKEIYLLPQMDHQNLLKLIGYSIKEMNYYLIFNYADCGSLKDYLRFNIIENENQLISMLKQLSDGIEYLHRDFRSKSSTIELTRSSIAHRDLKSDNILLDSNEKLVICDFAMSTIIDEYHLSTFDHQQIGTARYMAPEILAGTIGNDSNALLRCDVYALGLIFWEILSRYSILEGSHQYRMPYEEQLIEKHFNRNPSIDEMLQIINLESPLNRPLIYSSWRNLRKINEILLTIEQCWHSTPEGRINSSLVAHRIRQIN